jgi:hypothetical protein
MYWQHCGEPAISLHSHHVSLVQWTACLLPVMRDLGSIPAEYLCETGILLLLHWRLWHDWSFWSRLRQASFTRLSCRQCDNPTWSHTALLSWFHARCRSSFRPHNRHSRLMGGEPCGEPAISLHSYLVSLVQWTTRFLPVMRDLGSIPRGYLCETGILLLALSCYSTLIKRSIRPLVTQPLLEQTGSNPSQLDLTEPDLS